VIALPDAQRPTEYMEMSTFHDHSSPRRHKGMEIDKPATFVVLLFAGSIG
jgi:hypothetical protein